MRGKFKFFKYRFAITRGIIHRATYIATHTRRNAYPRISTTSARCLSWQSWNLPALFFFSFPPLLHHYRRANGVWIFIRCTYELDVHLDRRVVDTHLALTHLVHATWPRFELFILWQRIYIIYISDRVRRCPISRSIGTSVERSFLHFLVARICAHETWNCTIGCMIRERIGRERRKGLLNGRAVETPRAEIWTTMSAVRRGGRKNCGGARRPQEDV